ncbi:MAG: MFS transporter [Patescibacteria group bacterium]|nr:MFS transporter [Patescibacteria group bacterium]
MWRSFQIRLNGFVERLVKFSTLSGEAKKAVAIQVIFTFAATLSGTFLNIFLWKETQSLTSIALHNIAWAVSIPLFFVLNGYLLKKFHITISIKVGLAILATFYLWLLFLGSHSNSYLILFGFIRGGGEALFWSSYNLLTYDFTHDKNRDVYFGVNGILNTVFGVFAPFLAGFLMVFNGRLANLGYYLIFAFTIVLFLVALVISDKLRTKKKNSFRLKQIWRLHQRNKNWVNVQKASFIQGFSGGIFGFLVGILTFFILKNEISVGGFAGILGLLSLLTNFFITRKIKPATRVTYAFSGAVLLVLSSILLPISLSVTALFIFNLIRSIGMPLFTNSTSPMTLLAIDADREAAHLRYEYLVNNEIFTALGRSLVLALFIWFSSLVSDPAASRFILLLVGIAPLLVLFYLSKISCSVKTGR